MTSAYQQACGIVQDAQGVPRFQQLCLRLGAVHETRRKAYLAQPSARNLELLTNSFDWAEKMIALRERDDRETFLKALSFGVFGLEQGEVMTLTFLVSEAGPVVVTGLDGPYG